MLCNESTENKTYLSAVSCQNCKLSHLLPCQGEESQDLVWKSQGLVWKCGNCKKEIKEADIESIQNKVTLFFEGQFKNCQKWFMELFIYWKTIVVYLPVLYFEVVPFFFFYKLKWYFYRFVIYTANVMMARNKRLKCTYTLRNSKCLSNVICRSQKCWFYFKMRIFG